MPSGSSEKRSDSANASGKGQQAFAQCIRIVGELLSRSLREGASRSEVHRREARGPGRSGSRCGCADRRGRMRFPPPPALERFECCRQRGPIHRRRKRPAPWGEERGGSATSEGKLPICESKRTQRFIKAACQGARDGAVVQTQAGVPYHDCGFVREYFCT